MLLRDNFPQLCESWRDHQSQDGYLADIVDGQVWKEFQSIDGEPWCAVRSESKPAKKYAI